MQCACAVLYCYVWLIRLYNSFPHYPINDIIFEGGDSFWTQYVCVLTCSTTLSELFLTSRKIQRDNIICTLSMCYSSQILMKFEFSRQIFDKSSNFKLNKNSTSGSRVAPCGRTDRLIQGRHDEANNTGQQIFTDVMLLRQQ